MDGAGVEMLEIAICLAPAWMTRGLAGILESWHVHTDMVVKKSVPTLKLGDDKVTYQGRSWDFSTPRSSSDLLYAVTVRLCCFSTTPVQDVWISLASGYP